MRTLKRNRRPIWFCIYEGETELVDENGDYTGEVIKSYTAPISVHANVSPASGQIAIEAFGTDESYDRVIAMPWDSFEAIFSPSDYGGTITADGKWFCTEDGFDKFAVFFIDHEPDDPNSADGYDYVVHRIAMSINGLLIAVRKVEQDADNSNWD